MKINFYQKSSLMFHLKVDFDKTLCNCCENVTTLYSPMEMKSVYFLLSCYVHHILFMTFENVGALYD